MTAVDVDALDKLREALAEAMASSARGNTYAQWAATILPVVVQFANQRAAAELRSAAFGLDQAADEQSGWCGPWHDLADGLRHRADSLDPS